MRRPVGEWLCSRVIFLGRGACTKQHGRMVGDLADWRAGSWEQGWGEGELGRALSPCRMLESWVGPRVSQPASQLTQHHQFFIHSSHFHPLPQSPCSNAVPPPPFACHLPVQWGAFALALVLSLASAIPIVSVCRLPECGKHLARGF